MNHTTKKVKIIRCSRPEYNGTIQQTYYIYSNGIDFISKYGLLFVEKGDYIIIE